jgi:hypothetical protein
MATFQPALEGWIVRTLPITRDDLIDANIAAYSLVRDYSSSVTNNRQPITNNPYLTRLVHGYNMPMCMKMKYYTVEKILDNRVRPISDPKLHSAFHSAPQQLSTITTQQLASRELPFQLWRLTSSVGTVSIWVTTMIRADDFSPTMEDICSMVFPRIEIPDDPHWIPRGLGMEDLKHPGVAFNLWYHSRWDGSRWDVLTFMGLRRPARTSEELLSYVTRIDGLPDNDAISADIQTLLNIHIMMLKELQGWRNGNRPAPGTP